MAELVDAHDSDSCPSNGVQVQLLPRAPLFNARQAYETNANNNRSCAHGVRRCKDSDILFFGGAITVIWNQKNGWLLLS